jgi:hypothetical protein
LGVGQQNALGGDTYCVHGVDLALHKSFGDWSVEVNGESVIKHADFLPWITWKGSWNATPLFLTIWYDFGPVSPYKDIIGFGSKQ